MIDRCTLWLATALTLVCQTSSLAAGGSRDQALKALCGRLEIGPGAVIADVGCGEGLDAAEFARVVGESGTVLAQEIEPAKLATVVRVAAKHGLHQIVPVLGQSDDPRLPDGFVDLIYLNRVFHHLAQPQAMLRRLHQDLKPGGLLVVVDQHRGPLTDWAPTERREEEHHWTGETTVVRLAREAGFLFHDVLEDVWHEPQPFVLAFRKPAAPPPDAGDPDLPPPLDAKALVRALPIPQQDGWAAIFVGLDRGRAVLPALKEGLPPSTRLADVVLDEWALTLEELPPGAPHPGTEVLRKNNNSLALPPDMRLGLVLFVDAYQWLWEPVPLLRQLRERMPNSGLLAIVERQGPDDEPRRLAGHHRRISSRRVAEEMREAGFQLRQTLAAPTEDRCFLLFEPRTSHERLQPEAPKELRP